MRPETAALAGLLGRCARASSVDALAAEAAAAEPLCDFFDRLCEDAEARGSPCADLRALLAAGVQQRLAQAVARALALRAAPATRAEAAGSEGFAGALRSLCDVLTGSFCTRKVLGAPEADLAADVERAGMLSPLAVVCTAVAAELEAQQQRQRQQQQRRRQQGSGVPPKVCQCESLVAAAPLWAAHAVSNAWLLEGQLEGPLLPLAQPAARLALAVLRRAGAWRAGTGSDPAVAGTVPNVLFVARTIAWWTAQSLVLARHHGRVSDEAERALADPAVQQLLLANLALRAAHLHEAQHGRQAGVGGSSGGSGAPTVPARHAALLRALGLELDAAKVPQGDHSDKMATSSIYAVAMLFDVSPPTSCGGVSSAGAGAGAGAGLPLPGGAGLAAAAAEVALELAALQPSPRVLAAGASCAGAIMSYLMRASLVQASGGGALSGDPAAAAAAAAVVRAFLPLARPTAAALLAAGVAASSSTSRGAAVAGRGGARAQTQLGAVTAEDAVQCCALLLVQSNGPAGVRRRLALAAAAARWPSLPAPAHAPAASVAAADAVVAAFAQQAPSTLCRLLDASARSWAGRAAPQAALNTAQVMCGAIARLGPSLADAPALTATGGGAGLRLQREVFACLLTALKCVTDGAPLAAAEANPSEQLWVLATGCLAVVRTGCAVGDTVARAQPAAVAAAGGQLAYEPPALWAVLAARGLAVLAARGLAVLAQLLSLALAPRAPIGARVSASAGVPGELVQLATAAAVLAALRNAATLLGPRLRALGSLPADASRAGLARLLAQQEQLHTASAKLAAQLADVSASAAARASTLQERGPALAAQAEELCSAVCAALPLRACCNNPRCAALAGALSELAAVGGRACVCGGCIKSAAPARFCSRACQVAAWRAHKPVCRALAAGVAAAAAASPRRQLVALGSPRTAGAMTRLVREADARRDTRLLREFAASGIAVGTANTVLNPVEVVKIRMQLAGAGAPGAAPAAPAASGAVAAGRPAFAAAGGPLLQPSAARYISHSAGAAEAAAPGAAAAAARRARPWLLPRPAAAAAPRGAAAAGAPAEAALAAAATALRGAVPAAAVGAAPGAQARPGFLATAALIMRQEGPSGFTRGIQATTARAVCNGGIRLGLYDPIKCLLSADGSGADLHVGQKLAAGSISGGIGAVMTTPMELVKTRLQAPNAGTRSARDVLQGVLRQQGVRGLWTGASPSVLRLVMLNASMCGTYDEVKGRIARLTGWGPGVPLVLSSSMVAGLVTTTVINPADVCRSYMQTGRGGSLLGVARGIVAAEGARGFLKGWTAAYCRTGPQTLIIFTVSELVRPVSADRRAAQAFHNIVALVMRRGSARRRAALPRALPLLLLLGAGAAAAAAPAAGAAAVAAPAAAAAAAAGGAHGELIDITLAVRAGMPVWEQRGGLFKAWRALHQSIAEGDVVNQSWLNLDAHTGTHVDAPAHFLDGGATVEQLDLSALVGPALLVDLPRDANVTGDVLRALELPPGVERLLLRTANTDRGLLHATAFASDYVGLDSTAAAHITRDTGIRLVGIDYLSIGHLDDIIATHKTLFAGGVVVVEGLDLGGVPAGWHTLLCLPAKLAGADGAPVRCVLAPLPADGGGGGGAQACVAGGAV
ncbi:CYL3 [Scenedesmus sp. PABB004]|nr:CYL3 [Scenedesmus sp. PABB004]